MALDCVASNPEHYRVVMENERVRVLLYEDVPGVRTVVHRHPDSVMWTLSSFRRRLVGGQSEVDVELPAGAAVWLPAQEHLGENIGETDTRVLFVELKEPAPVGADPGPGSGTAVVLGPD
ncbi:hypothetical protein [Nocardioides sp. Leaf307]|uniref:hypothetical protein n=1 Tax=Nocardioides sp. Leaf307 TaxID=1736331 RepID=UPI000702D139|nr:hypothetical protein [Nocardioides sp. Leaf307]KQQ41896.1 cytoplasmic protein [Nocardioides sp. Leaf307]